MKTLQHNTIHHGNCFELLPSIPDASVDAIITDPPYETTGLHFDKKGLIDWDLFYSQMKRVLKPTGWFFLFGTLQMYKKASDYFRDKFQYIWVKNNIIFQTASAVKPFNKHENIFAFVNFDVKASLLTFNKKELRTVGEIYMKVDKPIKSQDKSNFMKDNYGLEKKEYIRDNKGYREGSTILEAPIAICLPYNQRFSHPTAKPLSLIETLVKGYTNEGDLVLDPFAGSGTTAVACQNLNRNFIAMELHEEYVNIGRKRLKESFNLFTDDAFRTE